MLPISGDRSIESYEARHYFGVFTGFLPRAASLRATEKSRGFDAPRRIGGNPCG